MFEILLLGHFEKQAIRMGADIRYGLATKVDLSAHPHKVWIDEEKLLEAYKDNVWPLGADFEPHWCLVLSLDTRLAAIV